VLDHLVKVPLGLVPGDEEVGILAHEHVEAEVAQVFLDRGLVRWVNPTSAVRSIFCDFPVRF
jgi:hypothetical protein